MKFMVQRCMIQKFLFSSIYDFISSSTNELKGVVGEVGEEGEIHT